MAVTLDGAASAVGLATLSDADWSAHFGRFVPLPNNLPQPLALRYHGHQFQTYNPDLGDGRGFLFAQLHDESGRLLDLGVVREQARAIRGAALLHGRVGFGDVGRGQCGSGQGDRETGEQGLVHVDARACGKGRAASMSVRQRKVAERAVALNRSATHPN